MISRTGRTNVHGPIPHPVMAGIAALLLMLVLALALLAPEARAGRTISWGSSLSSPPARSLNAPVDTAYWQPLVAPKAGQIVAVTLWGRVVSGQPTVLFQDLRPLGGGELKVISTTQPFQLTGAIAKHTFRPINFFVHKGDHVGLATIGGSYEVFAARPSASAFGFVGAGHDMNGSSFAGTPHHGYELLQRMTEKVG
ncbi:MAG TPA: hypothetical protein VMB05_10585 [Solirubrobacteraceae bacterium]|nr:hypothetical protein [Solirubrobacteraceae bacterium]